MTKRFISVLCIVIMLLFICPAVSLSQNTQIMFEDFEAFTEGQSFETNENLDIRRAIGATPNGNVVISSEKSKACKIELDSAGQAANTLNYIGRSGLNVTSGKFIVETKVKGPGIGAESRNDCMLLVKDNDGGNIWRFSNGKIYVGNGGGLYQQIQSYVTDKWYTIQAIVDSDNKLVTVNVIDEAGALKKGSMPTAEIMNFEIATGATLTYRLTAAPETGVNTFIFDDVKMYQGEADVLAAEAVPAPSAAPKPSVAPEAAVIETAGRTMTVTTELTDIKGSQYEGAIAYLENQQVISGYEDKTFRADNTMTRAEFAAVFVRKFYDNANTDLVRYSIFDDVPNTHWAMREINLAAATGVVSGFGDGRFGPDENITLEQAVKMLVVAKGKNDEAMGYGGYPNGYLVSAGKSGYLDNLLGDIGTNIKRGAVAQLLFNSDFPSSAGMTVSVKTPGASVSQPEIPVVTDIPKVQDSAQPLGHFPEIKGGKIIKLSDYGANPLDNNDDTPAFTKAVEAAKKEIGGVTFVFEKGKYYVQDSFAGFDIRNMNNVVMEGNGAEIIARSDAIRVLSFTESKNVLVKDLSIYWEKYYCSQGEVVATTDSSIDVRFPAHYPISESIKVEALMDYDPITKYPIGNLDLFGSAITSYELIANQVMRFTIKSNWGQAERVEHLKESLLNMEKGTTILVRHAIYGPYAIDIEICENVMVENVNIWHVPGMAIHDTRTNNFYMKNVRIEPMPDTDRVMATTGDAVFTMFPMGEVLVEDCKIEGSGDDCLPINGKYMEVTDIDRTKNSMEFFVRVGWEGPIARPGDRYDFYNGADLDGKGTLTVLNASFDKENKRHKVAFAESIPENFEIDDVAYNSSYTSKSVVVRNSVLGSVRSRATIVSARNVLFENVKFHHTGLIGAMIWGDKLRSHRPAPSAETVTFKDCVFENCGLSALHVFTGADNPSRAQKDINIINCKFIDNKDSTKYNATKCRYKLFKDVIYIHAGLFYRDVYKGVISGNTFEGYETPICIYNCKDISVTDNSVLDKTAAPMYLDANSCENVKEQDNKNFIKKDSTAGLNLSFLYYNDLR